MCSRELAQRHQSLVAVDRYTDPIDRVVREKHLSRMEKMRADRKELCVVWQEKMVCVCCTVHPSEAPEHLGLRVLRSRGCRGEKSNRK